MELKLHCRADDAYPRGCTPTSLFIWKKIKLCKVEPSHCCPSIIDVWRMTHDVWRVTFDVPTSPCHFFLQFVRSIGSFSPYLPFPQLDNIMFSPLPLRLRRHTFKKNCIIATLLTGWLPASLRAAFLKLFDNLWRQESFDSHCRQWEISETLFDVLCIGKSHALWLLCVWYGTSGYDKLWNGRVFGRNA